MKAAIISQYETDHILSQLKRHGFEIVKKNPDFVLCYGGDGTILFSERMFPGIPKLAVKHTNICHRCELESGKLDKSLEKIKHGNFSIVDEPKLEAVVGDRKLVGLNEIQVHASSPIEAARFSVTAGSKHFDNLIGDGVIIATPFGSTAYYRSTGGKPFKKGIGISFNNLHPKPIKSFTIPENSQVSVRINRGSAYLIADNNNDFITLNAGDVATIKSNGHARFIQV